MYSNQLKYFLDKKVTQYQTASFIKEDPIAIPHRYTVKQDVEIAGFFAALFAWGRRTTILNKTSTLLQMMDEAPFAFVTGHEESDLEPLMHFAHRTFNGTDILFLISFLRKVYQQYDSLEYAFIPQETRRKVTTEAALNHFYQTVFSDEEHPKRTEKHISAPFKKSACKRMNMYLRWMVREGKEGVDFGLWKQLQPEQLVIPLDVHVCRVATRLQLIPEESKVAWKTAVQLTDHLKAFDPGDPVKYDYALFGLGAMEKFQ